MTRELIRLQKFYTVDLSIPGVWILKLDFIPQGNQGWVTKWQLFSQLLLILFCKACRYSNMWTSEIISACYFVIQLFSFLCLFFNFIFSKGSVKVDFRVIIVINATDPKNASAIPDAKAETTHRVVREAKTGFVKQLQVSPVVEVFSKYQLVTLTRNS